MSLSYQLAHSSMSKTVNSKSTLFCASAVDNIKGIGKE